MPVAQQCSVDYHSVLILVSQCFHLYQNGVWLRCRHQNCMRAGDGKQLYYKLWPNSEKKSSLAASESPSMKALSLSPLNFGKEKKGEEEEKEERKKKKKKRKKRNRKEKYSLTASHPSVKDQRPQERWIGAHWESQETPVAQLP